MQSLSAAEARRIAIAAQGFGQARPRTWSKRRLIATIERLGVIQIDSVNVVSRSHYLPLFSRLGAYPRAMLEDLAWAKKRPLFEYWGHEASLMPLSLQPMLRWRMQDAHDGVGTWKGVARFLREHRPIVDRALAEIAARGPLAASDLEALAQHSNPRGAWWEWSEAKRATECLFWTGELTCATRRGSFERVYGLPQQVLPPAIVDTPTPSRADAQRTLVWVAAQAMGVATVADLRDYFRMGPAEGKARVDELVEEGRLAPVRIEGWRQLAYVAAGVDIPRSVRPRALLSPFDNLIWFRERTERLFGVRVRLEIYTPAHKRTHGYYVLPFLEGAAITARVDLKADRKAGVLIVQAAHAERSATKNTPLAVAAELQAMAAWLGLSAVQVAPSGDLSPALAQATAAT
ncbi:MAG TPA: winged helix-turn-helix domain-containing protein [Caulobacteraceae bacterium]|nr:winged helix-turn-helix domain-containing protein [Caulobacteraceae bacterium]